MYTKKREIIYLLFLAFIFASLLVFFAKIHPLQVFDNDDWTYIAFSRDAIPDSGEWNPTRVFPEIFMPLCGAFAAYVVTPIINDYVFSLTIVSAVVLSIFIILYIHSFGKAMEKYYSLNIFQIIVIVLFFFLCHFWVFRSSPERNKHLFFPHDLTCAFYYIIPTLLNAILILFFETNPNNWIESSYLKRGFILLFLYLAIFSNLFCSIVIAIYSAASLVIKIIMQFWKKRITKELLVVLKDNSLHVAIVLTWFISLCFELTGGRAKEVGQGFSFGQIKSVLNYLYSLITSMNIFFFATGFVVIAVSILLLIKFGLKDKTEQLYVEKMVLFLICGLLTTVFLILLCAVGNLTHYIGRSDVSLSFYFYFLLLVCTSLSYIIKKLPKLQEALPLLVLVIAFNINTQGSTFCEPNDLRIDPEKVYRFSTDILNQIMYVSQSGETEMVLHIPKYNDPNNWPHIMFFGERLSNTLYEHGMIESPITITLIPDTKVNEYYGLPQ